MMTTDLMTVAAAAQRLGMHEATVRRLIARGELPAVRVGRQLRVSPAAIDALVALAEGRPNAAVTSTPTMDADARGLRR